MKSTARFQWKALDWKVYLLHESFAAVGKLPGAVTDTLIRLGQESRSRFEG